MNANRKADLQRKLSIAPLPKPPAGLAERIKKEIPQELRFDVDKERERLSHSMMFTMRVAASILILVTSAYLGIRFVSRLDEEGPRPAALDQVRRQAPIIAPATATVAKAAEAQPAPPAAAPKSKRERHAKKDQAVDAVAAAAPPPAVPAPLPPAEVAEKITAMREEAKPARTLSVAQSAMRDDQRVTAEMTTSPISGKVLVRAGNEVVEPVSKTMNANVKLVAWKDASRETKLAILKTELAHGGDVHQIARVAREAGLTEFADSIEKR